MYMYLHEPVARHADARDRVEGAVGAKSLVHVGFH